MRMRSYKKTRQTRPSKKCSKNGKSMKNKKGGSWFWSSNKSNSLGGDNSTYELIYNNNGKKCEICGNNDYEKIYVSINRSKTFDTVSTLFGLGSVNSTAGHPLTMYRCVKCNNCKFFYTKTPLNNVNNVVVDRKIEDTNSENSGNSQNTTINN